MASAATSPGAGAPRQAKLGPSAGIGVGKAIKAGWVVLEAGTLKPKATTIVDEASEQLKAIAANGAAPPVDANTLKDLKKRRLAQHMSVVGSPRAQTQSAFAAD